MPLFTSGGLGLGLVILVLVLVLRIWSCLHHCSILSNNKVTEGNRSVIAFAKRKSKLIMFSVIIIIIFTLFYVSSYCICFSCGLTTLINEYYYYYIIIIIDVLVKEQVPRQSMRPQIFVYQCQSADSKKLLRFSVRQRTGPQTSAHLWLKRTA